jgi:hypothetical protein
LYEKVVESFTTAWFARVPAAVLTIAHLDIKVAEQQPDFAVPWHRRRHIIEPGLDIRHKSQPPLEFIQ